MMKAARYLFGWIAFAAAAPLAAASPSSTEVANAKASLLEAADAAFVEMWSQYGDAAMSDGVPASQMRSAARWTFLAYTLGLCVEMVPDPLMADWHAAFDQINFGYGPTAEEGRRKFRQGGMDLFAKGTVSTDYGPPRSAEHAKICRVQLAAIRAILREPL